VIHALHREVRLELKRLSFQYLPQRQEIVMSKMVKLLVGVSFSVISSSAFSQTVNVAWSGPQSVPLSPSLTAVIALVLGLAAYAFIRKRAGQGLLALVIASALGVAGYNEHSLAEIDTAAYTIRTSSGSVDHECGEPLPNYLGTDVTGGVTLTRVDVAVEPKFSPSSQTNIKSLARQGGNVQIANGYPDCAVGLPLKPGDLCELPCGSSRD
jgi:hypothetical protein